MKSIGLKQKVFVGLSGGVDSSVSAALLKQVGFDVTGVFIRVWTPDWLECTWKEDRLDAMRVCAKLGIPFMDLNLEKEYKREVVDYLIREYKVGRTPNPDVMCNKHIKFGAFYNWAMKHGADYVATGHYAEIQKSKIKNQNDNFKLKISKDKEKDQTYFLWQIKKEQMFRILFPVGGFEKSQVRSLAKKFGLITADKKDSQGLCFMGKIDMKEFLKKYIKPKKGVVYDKNEKIIGQHDGAYLFTLGERHGFTINQKTSSNKPYYVIGKDIRKNILIVSNNSRLDGEGKVKKIFAIEKTNWLGEIPTGNLKLLARIRYRQPLEKAKLIIHGVKIRVEFKNAQSGGTSGQSIVFYRYGRCLGGGIIV